MWQSYELALYVLVFFLCFSYHPYVLAVLLYFYTKWPVCYNLNPYFALLLLYCLSSSSLHIPLCHFFLSWYDLDLSFTSFSLLSLTLSGTYVIIVVTKSNGTRDPACHTFVLFCWKFLHCHPCHIVVYTHTMNENQTSRTQYDTPTKNKFIGAVTAGKSIHEAGHIFQHQKVISTPHLERVQIQ